MFENECPKLFRKIGTKPNHLDHQHLDVYVDQLTQQMKQKLSANIGKLSVPPVNRKNVLFQSETVL